MKITKKNKTNKIRFIIYNGYNKFNGSIFRSTQRGHFEYDRWNKKNCAGIDIYLGFIGYKDFTDLDFGDEYVNLEFTNDYKAIKNQIEPLKAQGGGDIPKDRCGAFDLAVKKGWEGKSRFAILVTNFPCHGSKYHNFTGWRRR